MGSDVGRGQEIQWQHRGQLRQELVGYEHMEIHRNVQNKERK